MHRLFTESTRKHFLTRLDGRVKLLSALALLAMVLTYHGYLFPLLVTAFCVATCLRLRVPLRRLLIRFSEPAFIVLVLILIKAFFSGKEVWTVHVLGSSLTVYRDGLIDGLLIGCRIIAAVSIMASLVSATPFTEFLASLAWLKVPKGIIETAMLAYRYLFLLLDDAAVIYNAQKNRLGYSTLKRSFSSLGVLAGSLTLKAFDNSQHAATAMIQRGYDGKLPMAAQRPLSTVHVALSVLFLAFMVFLWKM